MAINKIEEISRAAVKLFEKKGYHATSVQDIANEVGLQKGSLYHYIASKEELLLNIALQSVSGFNRRLESILNLDMNNQQKLMIAIEAHLCVVTANLQMTTVLLRESFSLGEPQGHAITEQTDRYLDLWTQIIQQGIDCGEFKENVNSRLTALAILGACNWMYRWYQPGKLQPSDIAKMFSYIFLEGIC